jgi:Ca2+-binding RTX toxin-like protein
MISKPSRLTIVGIDIVTSLLIVSVLLLLGIPSIKDVQAIELNSINEIISNFTRNLYAGINDIVSTAANSSNSIMNSSSIILSNESNMTSSQVVASSNVLKNNNNVSGGSIIANQVTSSNGVCDSNIIGGAGNDTLSSTGVCNDQLTGGLGGDKFICGSGTDTIRDFNSKEGDIIIDQGNCESIL